MRLPERVCTGVDPHSLPRPAFIRRLDRTREDSTQKKRQFHQTVQTKQRSIASNLPALPSSGHQSSYSAQVQGACVFHSRLSHCHWIIDRLLLLHAHKVFEKKDYGSGC